MGRSRNKGATARSKRAGHRQRKFTLAYPPRFGRGPHGPKEFWFAPNLRGWPGWRTRQGRTGYDYIDAEAEAAFVQGTLLRQFFTFSFQSRSKFNLLLLFVYGLNLVLLSFVPTLPYAAALIANPTALLLSPGLIVVFIIGSIYGVIGGVIIINVVNNMNSLRPLFTITDLESSNTQAIDQAAAILVEAFKEHWPDAWPTHEEAHSEVLGMLAEDRICRVAVDGTGTALGWIGGIPQYDGNMWELHPLAIRPDMQQQGIGRALVQDLEREVNQRGGLTISLGSDDQDDMTSLSNVNLYEDLGDKIKNIQNFKGHPYEFYQKLGYNIIGVMPDANGRGKPDIIMGKRIG